MQISVHRGKESSFLIMRVSCVTFHFTVGFPQTGRTAPNKKQYRDVSDTCQEGWNRLTWRNWRCVNNANESNQHIIMNTTTINVIRNTKPIILSSFQISLEEVRDYPMVLFPVLFSKFQVLFFLGHSSVINPTLAQIHRTPSPSRGSPAHVVTINGIVPHA